MDADVVTLFHDLRNRFPSAAAGLLQDLCTSLGVLVQRNPDATKAIDERVATIRECFRPMDAAYAFECHAWDQATHDFSRWLNGTRPVLHAAVRDITGWPEDKLADLKNVYPRNIRAIRDEHELALQQITESDS